MQPFTPFPHLQDLACWNQIIRAVNERMMLVTTHGELCRYDEDAGYWVGPYDGPACWTVHDHTVADTLIAGGQRIQSSGFVGEWGLQRMVQYHLCEGTSSKAYTGNAVFGHRMPWLDPTLAPGVDLEELPIYATFADLCQAATGFPGWRKCQEWPGDWRDPNNPKVATGYAAPGDVFGPWILDDLQKVLALMRVSFVPLVIGSGDAWSMAWGDADYASAAWHLTQNWSNGFSPPSQGVFGAYASGGYNGEREEFVIWAMKSKLKGTVELDSVWPENPAAWIEHSGDFMLSVNVPDWRVPGVPEAPAIVSAWDSNGEAVERGKWKKVATYGKGLWVSQDVEIGLDGFPGSCPAISAAAPVPGVSDNCKGFWSRSPVDRDFNMAYCILNWDFTNGGA